MAIAIHGRRPTAGVHPTKAPIATAQKISRGDARSDLARLQSVLVFSHSLRNKHESLAGRKTSGPGRRARGSIPPVLGLRGVAC